MIALVQRLEHWVQETHPAPPQQQERESGGICGERKREGRVVGEANPLFVGMAVSFQDHTPLREPCFVVTFFFQYMGRLVA